MLHIRRRIVLSHRFKTQPQTQFQSNVNLMPNKSKYWNQLKIFNPFAMFYYNETSRLVKKKII